MTGSEHNLFVMFGSDMVAILKLQDGVLSWQYCTDWQEKGFAVSPYLPLQGDIPSAVCEKFIRNLFPEGQGFSELLTSFRVSKQNTFGIIRQIGRDTSGALTFNYSLDNQDDKTSFRLIEKEELLVRLKQKSSLIIWDEKPRLSVAGVQDKLNILIDQNNQMGFGEGDLSSTHILKFEPAHTKYLALNEYYCMQLAGACGLATAFCSILSFDNFHALLVKRFDRKLKQDKNRVLKRHLIDGCQALNLGAESQYERNLGNSRDVANVREGVSFQKLFAFAEKCINPAATKLAILDWALFNLLIENSDAHGKNISFFISGKGIQLAPFYDLVNIGVYPEYEQQLAMAFGDEFNMRAVNAYQLADFADSCSLKPVLVQSRLSHLLKKLLAQLDSVWLPNDLDEASKQFLAGIKKNIQRRAKHFSNQLSLINEIEL